MARSRRKPFVLPARAGEDRLLAGVCAALADNLDVDVTLVRLGFFLLSFAWGLGLVAYGLLWLLLPAPGAGSRRDLRGTVRANVQNLGTELSASADTLSRAWNRRSRHRWPHPLDRRWIAIGMISTGALLLLASLGAFSWLNATRGFGLAVIVFGAAVLLRMRGEG